MSIAILDKPITKAELSAIAKDQFGDFVKAVVDVSKEVVAIGAELHADLEALLLERGSGQIDLWGINLYPDVQGDGFIEFDSMINIRPSQRNRSRSVEDAALRERIRSVIAKFVR